MPKAARVLAALKRDGWVQVRQKGSHRQLVPSDGNNSAEKARSPRAVYGHTVR